MDKKLLQVVALGSLLRSSAVKKQTDALLQGIRMHAMVAGGSATSFDIPQAPVLISPGPWREIDGCVCAPKGFKAQGLQSHEESDHCKADISSC